MRATHSASRFLRAGVLAAVVVVAAGWAVAPAAGAATSLRVIVLPHTVPGYRADPPGRTNGPMTPSNLNIFQTSGSGALSVLIQRLANGQVEGYLRVFRSGATPHSGIVIVAMRFADSGAVAPFLAGVQHAALGRPGAVRFSVAALPTDAFGTTVPLSTRTAEYAVAFGVSDTAFLVFAVSRDHALSAGDASTVAADQYTRATSLDNQLLTGGSSGGGLGLLLVLAVVLAGAGALVAVLLRRSRRAQPAGWDVPVGGSSSPTVDAASPVVVVVPHGAPVPEEPPVVPPEPKTYCMWCGKEDPHDALMLHYCGSKDRPATFCANCGKGGAAEGSSCTSCGTLVEATRRRS